MEPPYDALDGVISTTSGYTGGDVDNPTYRIVSRTETGHHEAVLVVYDPAVVDYRRLLEVFWVNIDPLDPSGQFCDRGSSYRSAIFVADDGQDHAARASLRSLSASSWIERFDRPVATVVRPLETFWVAEEEHQDYYQKRPFSYRYYRGRCRRDDRLAELWGPEDNRRALIQGILPRATPE